MLKISNNINIPMKELSFSFSKATGPGGQKVNKTNTKVLLRWNIFSNTTIDPIIRDRLIKKLQKKFNVKGELSIKSDRFRDRGRNIADCLEKLRDILMKASIVPKKRIKTKPSKNALEKRIDRKKQHSQIKQRRQKVNW